MEKKHTSLIRKKIGRKIQTKKFESLEVYVDIEEQIGWDTISERNEKTKKVTQVLLKDFKTTMVDVIKELKLHRNTATIENSDYSSSSEETNNIDITEVGDSIPGLEL